MTKTTLLNSIGLSPSFEFGILVPPTADYLFVIWDLLFVILRSPAKK